MASPSPADADLVRGYLGGDERGATELVIRHTPGIARFLAGAGADPGDLEDLVQETFIRAFRALATWRGEASFRGWLLRIAVNLLRDQYRRRRGRAELPLGAEDLLAHDDPAATLDAKETERRMEAALGGLPRLQREVFLLRAQQGIDYQGIADALGTTPGAARVHYHHAVKRLKEMIE